MYYFTVESETDPEDFNRKIGALMNKIRSEAVLAENEGPDICKY